MKRSASLSQSQTKRAKHAFKPTEKLLGKGVYSNVYLVKRNGTWVAKKVFKDAVHPYYGVAVPVLRECSILAKLRAAKNLPFSDRVIRGTGEFEADGTPVLYLQFMEGSLRDVIPLDGTKVREPAFKPEMCCLDIAKGVYFYQSLNIIHRDLKPENILYYEDDLNTLRFVIADFGLARDQSCSADKLINMSETAYSLPYRPPEVLMKGLYDQKSDVWALGCVFAEIFLKKLLFNAPFTGDETTDMVKLEKLQQTPGYVMKQISSIEGFLPRRNDLLNLISGMLQLNPKDRLTISDVLRHPYFGLQTIENIDDKKSCLAKFERGELSFYNAEESQEVNDILWYCGKNNIPPESIPDIALYYFMCKTRWPEDAEFRFDFVLSLCIDISLKLRGNMNLTLGQIYTHVHRAFGRSLPPLTHEEVYKIQTHALVHIFHYRLLFTNTVDYVNVYMEKLYPEIYVQAKKLAALVSFSTLLKNFKMSDLADASIFFSTLMSGGFYMLSPESLITTLELGNIFETIPSRYFDYLDLKKSDLKETEDAILNLAESAFD